MGVRASIAVCVLLGGWTSQAIAADESLAATYLYSGRLRSGDRQLTAHLNEHPDDDQARLGLAVVRVVHGVERLGQAMYRYGAFEQARRLDLPFLRLPVPENKDPQEVTYEDMREVIDRFVRDLARAERTLADITSDDVKLTLVVTRIRIDLNGDQKADERESLGSILQAIGAAGAPRRFDDDGEEIPRSAREVPELRIALDRADVEWLRGYCHMISAVGEFALAYDGQRLWDHFAHQLFAKPKTPYPFLKTDSDLSSFSFETIADVIAAVHLINFKLKEPERMKKALEHLRAVPKHSRAMWKLALAETDNDHEWIPNPKQTGVATNVRVTKEMIETWHKALDEADAILAGEKVIPFWRGKNEKLGVNFNKFFTEPRDFDLILWVQGAAAAPYLEEKPLSTIEVWEGFDRAFGGQLFGFALWWN